LNDKIEKSNSVDSNSIINANNVNTGAEDVNDEDIVNQNLTAEQKEVLFNKGTEPPFSGKFLNYHGNGIFVCANCGTELFDAKSKFESGSGWPSFYEAVDEKSIKTNTDKSHFMVRTEIMCSTCGGHLGHVFNDGPQPTGLRYCVNSLALQVKDKAK
jgi:peptide-methionine (R)-S-oxide reductase